jgi:3-oxoacyl-(acyl-carrier-protein) synthase
MSEPRVVVTGIGAVSPLGIGREALWKSATEGGVAASGAARLEVDDFDVAAILRTRGLRYIGRGTRFVACAARLALQDAGYDDLAELGLAVGTAFGNTTETFNFTHRTLTEGVGEVLPMASFDAALNSQANYTAVFLEAQRFTRTCCGMTASLEAVADSAAIIRAGRARAAVAVGVDYWNPELEEWLRFEHAELRTPVAEGAYALVLEEGDFATERGAPLLAEIGGSARRFDLERRGSALAEQVSREALAGRRPDLLLYCGEEPKERGAVTAAPLRCALRDLAGESLGARGALGIVLASLALSSRTIPGGDALPSDAGTVLVADFEPGANYVGVSVQTPGIPAAA